MPSILLTEADLAECLQVTEAKVREWRRQYGWPCVKIGRQVRFTDAQVDEIVRRHTAKQPVGDLPPALPGQTSLSAARNRWR